MELPEIFEKIGALRANLEKVLRGKPETIELAVTTLLSRGHLLIEDVPGVGKTTLAHAMARSINSSFQRIQFTSDLLPSDVIGVTIYNQANQSFEFRPGPIFANIVLADEINRATPKTQSALLEAMNEEQVSVDRVTHALPRPFMLLATQNPMEYAGTFPLPESQLDRFTMRLKIGYPDEATEREIVLATRASLSPASLEPVITAEEVLRIQDVVQTVKVDEDLVGYMLAIATSTRKLSNIRLGVSPRATMALHSTAQALALVNGRDYCTPDDVKRLAVPVFSHRIVPTEYGAQGGFEDTDLLMEEVLAEQSVPV